MENIFFTNWESIFRTAILTILGYFTMVLLLRISGKRTLSKMNAFDFIITIAVGSGLATLALNKQVSLADGFVAFSLFVTLQFCLTWLSVRNKYVRRLITNEPSMLFYNGAFLNKQMKKHRMTKEEVFKASRQKGFSSLENVDMVILETTGEITILRKRSTENLSTTANIPLDE